MTTCFLAPDPIQSMQFIPGGIVPAAGGKLFFYVAGSVSTKQTVYKDNAAAVSWSNPIVLDSGGNLPSGGEVWFPTGQTFKAVLAPFNDTDPPGSPYWSKDNLAGINDVSAASASTVTFIAAGSGAVSRTIQNKERDWVSLFDYMTTTQIADVQAGTAAVDVSLAVQNAFNASNFVYGPDGIYSCSTGITLISKSGFHFIGAGGGGATMTSGQTVFKWNGSSTGTFLTLTGTRDSILENFNITVGNAPAALSAAIDVNPTGRTQIETNNIFKNIGIVQRGGATNPDGSLMLGYRISRSTSGGNVDEFMFDKIHIAGASSAGVSIEHSQSVGHGFYDPDITFCGRGISTTLNGGTGGSYQCYNIDFGHNTYADFDLANSGGFSVYGGVSQNSGRLLITPAPANSSIYITLEGLNVAGAASVNADGKFIIMGLGGPLVLLGNSFYSSESPGVIVSFNQSNGRLVSMGNSYNTTTPFVNAGGQTSIASYGDRGWNTSTAAFQDLVISPGASSSMTIGAAGSASTLPAQPLGYMNMSIFGTAVKVPYYNP